MRKPYADAIIGNEIHVKKLECNSFAMQLKVVLWHLTKHRVPVLFPASRRGLWRWLGPWKAQ